MRVFTVCFALCPLADFPNTTRAHDCSSSQSSVETRTSRARLHTGCEMAGYGATNHSRPSDQLEPAAVHKPMNGMRAPSLRAVSASRARIALEQIQSTWWLIPDHHRFSKCQKNVKSVIGTRDDKQWPTEGGALKDGSTGVADASARASWCVCRVAQATTHR